MDSILDTIKKALGVELTDTGYDTDILLGINTALMDLNQLGVGPDEGFVVLDKEATWIQLLGDSKKLEGAKSYILLKTRLMFDPPSSSFVLQAIDNQIKELSYRLMSATEPPPLPDPPPEV